MRLCFNISKKRQIQLLINPEKQNIHRRIILWKFNRKSMNRYLNVVSFLIYWSHCSVSLSLEAPSNKSTKIYKSCCHVTKDWLQTLLMGAIGWTAWHTLLLRSYSLRRWRIWNICKIAQDFFNAEILLNTRLSVN